MRRQKDHSHPILSWLWQPNANAVAGVLEKFVWHLEQDPGAITGVLFTAACPAVVQIFQDGEGLLDQFVRLPSFDIDDESDTTGIMLEFGVIETLFGGKASVSHGCPSLVLLHSSTATQVPVLALPIRCVSVMGRGAFFGGSK
jgi:hypothetical protein